MLGFEFKYLSSVEMIEESKKLIEFSILEILLLIFSIALIYVFILYIIPYLNLYFKYNKKEKEKRKRKNMIKQIAMQKDINDEIEKEIWI